MATVTELIIKSSELANHPPLAETPLNARAMAWAELLYDVVPLDDLKPAFNAAFTTAKSDFPINAQAVKIGFDRVIELRRQAAQEVYEIPTTANDEIPCEWCHGGGWVSVDCEGFSVPYQVHLARGVRKCHLCSYWEIRNTSLRGQGK